MEIKESEDRGYACRSRWHLRSSTFPDLHGLVSDVQHDYFNRSLTFKALDAVVGGKPVVHHWVLSALKDPSREEFTVSQFDGNGNVLYDKVLTGVKLVGHKCNHNYECEGDDLMDHELTFTYDNLETK